MTELLDIVMTVCKPCLDGEGDECHTPGCSLYMHRVDLPITVYEVLEQVAWRVKSSEGGYGYWRAEVNDECPEYAEALYRRVESKGGETDA